MPECCLCSVPVEMPEYHWFGWTPGVEKIHDMGPLCIGCVAAISASIDAAQKARQIAREHESG